MINFDKKLLVNSSILGIGSFLPQKPIFFVFLLISLNLFAKKEPNIEKLLRKKIPNLHITKIDTTTDHFTHNFKLKLTQPLDHKNPEKGVFEQLIYLNHTSVKQPVLLITSGYNAKFGTRELCKMLQSNQIIVEYRYYGDSKPEIIDYQYLTNQQATEDLHRVITLFKKFYKNKWVSSGVSKGGETALIHKSFYPNDIDLTVAYVTPIIFDTEDNRTTEHIRKTTQNRCPQLYDFQRNALEKSDSLAQKLKKYAKENEMVFSIGERVAVEYAILEFTFSFWQWGGNCDEMIRNSTHVDSIFNYLDQTVHFSFYSDEIIDFYAPSFYQHLTELGYYGFDTEHLQDLLTIKNPTNATFAPKNIPLNYDPNFMKNVDYFLQTKGDNILYIYGELDTWSACSVTPSPKTNARRFDVKNGSHYSRIQDLGMGQRIQVYALLNAWLDLPIKPLPLVHAKVID